MDIQVKDNRNSKVCLLRLSNILRLLVMLLVLRFTDGRIYNAPPYDWVYLEDDCQPFYYSNETGESWNKRVIDLDNEGTRLYGYVQPTRDNVYRGPMNCAVKVVAPPGFRLVVRIPQVEIYHDETECTYDYISVIGATDELKYCGFGTVTHSIYSTSNWLIFKILASEWDASHSYIGFLLYYTAVNDGTCYNEGENATEWQCHSMGWCIPVEVVCDTKDNCGRWEDELSKVCGLTQGAIIAISVVSVLVGGTFAFFIGYCIYNHEKEKHIRERQQREIMPTAGYCVSRGQVSIIPGIAAYTSNGILAEPPPPYVPTGFVNTACDENNDTIEDSAITDVVNSQASCTVTTNGDATAVSNVVQVRPTIGEPPPAYTSVTGMENSLAVGFDALPEKPDSK